MEYFFETVETIGKGHGFAHYDGTHIFWLVLCLLVTVGACLLYRRLGEKGRSIMRWTVTGLILADELWKMVWLFVLDLYIPKYLPFHLCSINIFLILFHAIRPRNQWIGNFLYAICIPASLLALAFPTWTKLPLGNFMHLHSFTVHILLGLYPIMLTAGGDIKPRARMIPRCLLLLLGLALVAKGVNLLCDTNFMFLESASKGNPLYYFEEAFGNHLIGIPVLVPVVLAVMFLPVELARLLKKRRKTPKA